MKAHAPEASSRKAAERTRLDRFLSGRYRFAIFPEPILFGTPWADLYLNFTFAISSFGVNPSPKSSISINLRISTTASPF